MGEHGMSWYAVVEKATGKLLSVGSVVAKELPNGVEVRSLARAPRDNEQWDETTRAFVAAAPQKHPAVQISEQPEIAELTPAQKLLVRAAVKRVLGDPRG